MALWTKKKSDMLQSGMHAPAFELPALDGSRHSLAELLEHGPVLLAFFKVSCPVCQLTMPVLGRLSHNDAVQVIAISQDDATKTTRFNQQFGLTILTLLDSSAEGYLVSNAFGITNVPSMFVVETGGAISKAVNGFSKSELEEFGRRVNVIPFRPDENVPLWKAG